MAVGEVLVVDVELSRSSVFVSDSVAAVEADSLVDEGRTVVNVSGLSLEVRCVVGVALVGAGIGFLLELAIGVPGEVLGQRTSARLPSNACPNSDILGALALSQTILRAYSTLLIPLKHDSEQVLPSTKSFIAQPGMSVL